jgi:hypothetical protein
VTNVAAAKPALQPHQRALYEAFDPAGGTRFIAVSWPPGMGIHFTAIRIAERLSGVDGEGRVLMIVSYKALAEQLVQQLSRSGTRAILVDAYKFRELMDRTKPASIPWEQHTVYVLVSSLLLRDSVVSAISRSQWAFVAVSIDLVHPSSKTMHVLSELLSVERTPRVLWISSDRSDLEALPVIAGADWEAQSLRVNDLKLAGDTSFRQVEFELLVYHLSESEKTIDALIQRLSRVHDFRAYSEALRILKSEWPSSAAALENAVRRLGRQLTGDQDPIHEDGALQEEDSTAIDGVSSEGRTALASFVQQTLQQLEEVDTDSKYAALMSALKKFSNEKPVRACVLTRYRSTAAYLQAALEHNSFPVHSVHAGMTMADREHAFLQFSSLGGLLVCTPMTMSTAPMLVGVTALVLYDVPATKSLLRVIGTLRRGSAEEILRVCALSRPDDLQAVTRLSEAAEIIKTQG